MFNLTAIAQKFNVAESAIVRVEEWANCVFVVIAKIGARFVSKAEAIKEVEVLELKVDGKFVLVPNVNKIIAVQDWHIQSMIIGQRPYRVMPCGGSFDDYIRHDPKDNSQPVLTFKTAEQAMKYAEKLNKAVARYNAKCKAA